MPKVKTCPQCGATFDCFADDPKTRCWCDDLPPIMPVPATSTTPSPATGQCGCLCPACLRKTITQHQAATPPRKS